mmetsp:Transcript_10054/g.32594  ORF Transcript_10054/g.32594 Transcript_10054/m.32594 type:complete len:250 (+) Transcript_10054:789-1538(+)
MLTWSSCRLGSARATSSAATPGSRRARAGAWPWTGRAPPAIPTCWRSGRHACMSTRATAPWSMASSPQATRWLRWWRRTSSGAPAPSPRLICPPSSSSWASTWHPSESTSLKMTTHPWPPSSRRTPLRACTRSSSSTRRARSSSGGFSWATPPTTRSSRAWPRAGRTSAAPRATLSSARPGEMAGPLRTPRRWATPSRCALATMCPRRMWWRPCGRGARTPSPPSPSAPRPARAAAAASPSWPAFLTRR